MHGELTGQLLDPSGVFTNFASNTPKLRSFAENQRGKAKGEMFAAVCLLERLGSDHLDTTGAWQATAFCLSSPRAHCVCSSGDGPWFGPSVTARTPGVNKYPRLQVPVFFTALCPEQFFSTGVLCRALNKRGTWSRV